ncbi:MAG TPA: hypothetical protein DER68_04905 [Ruminococcaceae bacterium]|nr:hypothetical protein [Oscillospiraceae bacterium]
MLSAVGNKICRRDLFFGKFADFFRVSVKPLLFVLGKLNPLADNPRRFLNGLAVSRKRGERRELRGAFQSAHTLARFGARHINHIVIFPHFSPLPNGGSVIINIPHNKAVMTGMTACCNFFICFQKTMQKVI